jgi:hypothetical protein
LIQRAGGWARASTTTGACRLAAVCAACLPTCLPAHLPACLPAVFLHIMLDSSPDSIPSVPYQIWPIFREIFK